MAFDKPKVTIDLEEYNGMITTINTANADDQVLMARQVVIEVFNSRGDLRKAIERLSNNGIQLVVQQNEYDIGIKLENVTMSRIKK